VVREVLNAVPIALLLLAAVALTIAVVVGAVWLVRRTVPATREGFHAEISAPMLGVVAALFGLLLAFVIITAYENFIEAGADVDRKADSLASIVRDSTAFPQPDGERVRGAVRTYVRTVVDEEWELMREGGDSASASRALDGVFAALLAVQPTTPAATGFYDDSVRQLNDALDARRDRLQAARGGLPLRAVSADLLQLDRDRRLRRARGLSELLVPCPGPGRDRRRGRVLAAGARRPQLPVLRRRRDRSRAIRHRRPRAVLRTRPMSARPQGETSLRAPTVHDSRRTARRPRLVCVGDGPEVAAS
jgi:hypothetical protein